MPVTSGGDPRYTGKTKEEIVILNIPKHDGPGQQKNPPSWKEIAIQGHGGPAAGRPRAPAPASCLTLPGRSITYDPPGRNSEAAGRPGEEVAFDE